MHCSQIMVCRITVFSYSCANWSTYCSTSMSQIFTFNLLVSSAVDSSIGSVKTASVNDSRMGERSFPWYRVCTTWLANLLRTLSNRALSPFSAGVQKDGIPGMPTFSSVLSALGAVPGEAVLPLTLPLPPLLARYCWCLLALEFIPSAAGAGDGTTAASAAVVLSVILVCLIWL